MEVTVDNAQAALETLLQELFTAPDLRRWLALGPEGAQIALDLPGEIATQRQLVHQAVSVLEAKGQLNTSFFERLVETHEHRAADIRAVAVLWAARTPQTPTSLPLKATAFLDDTNIQDGFILAVFDDIAHLVDAPGGAVEAYHWALERGAAPAWESNVTVHLEGRPGGNTTIRGARLHIIEQTTPQPSYYLDCHEGGLDETIKMIFNLDEAGARARRQDEEVLHPAPGELFFDGSRVITLRGDEPLTLQIVAQTRTADVRWVLVLDTFRDGKRTPVEITAQGGAPFRTVALGAPVPTAALGWDSGIRGVRFVVHGPDRQELQRIF